MKVYTLTDYDKWSDGGDELIGVFASRERAERAAHDRSRPPTAKFVEDGPDANEWVADHGSSGWFEIKEWEVSGP